MKRIENIVAKGEIAHDEKYIFLPQCFQKLADAGSSESFVIMESGFNYSIYGTIALRRLVHLYNKLYYFKYLYYLWYNLLQANKLYYFINLYYLWYKISTSTLSYIISNTCSISDTISFSPIFYTISNTYTPVH